MTLQHEHRAHQDWRLNMYAAQQSIANGRRKRALGYLRDAMAVADRWQALGDADVWCWRAIASKACYWATRHLSRKEIEDTVKRMKGAQ